ncbi:hypothetical protein G6F60_014032 [Rhizopus arrhizus]|nr:hypothetical protein G6F60_014032 [Rhizopus arrhizus]
MLINHQDGKPVIGSAFGQSHGEHYETNQQHTWVIPYVGGAISSFGSLGRLPCTSGSFGNVLPEPHDHGNYQERNCAQVPRHVHSTVAEDIAQESAYQRSQAEAAMERMKHWLARLAFDLGPVDIDGDLCATHP